MQVGRIYPVSSISYLPLGLLLLLQFPFMFLDSLLVFAGFQSLRIRCHTRGRAERLLRIMPVFPCGSETVSDTKSLL